MRRPLLKAAYWGYGLRWRLLRPITLGVRMMLVHDDTVLLVRHSYQDTWIFPGGGVKRGETLAQAAQREALEEVGAIVLETPALVGVYANFSEGKNDHVALFVSERFAWTTPTDRWEIEGRALFALDALPPTLPPTLRRHIAEYRAGVRGIAGIW